MSRRRWRSHFTYVLAIQLHQTVVENQHGAELPHELLFSGENCAVMLKVRLFCLTVAHYWHEVQLGRAFAHFYQGDNVNWPPTYLVVSELSPKAAAWCWLLAPRSALSWTLSQPEQKQPPLCPASRTPENAGGGRVKSLSDSRQVVLNSSLWDI